MKKKFLMILAAGVFILGTGLPEKIYGDVGISINPGSWNAGTGGVGNYTSWNSGTPAGGGYFSVSNIGNQNVDLKIRAANTQNWTLAPAPALNQFSLRWGQTATAGVQPVWAPVSLVDSALSMSLSPAVDYKFDLKFQSPTQVTPPDLSALQQTPLTVTAAPAPVLPSSYTITGEWQVSIDSGVAIIGADTQNNLLLLFWDFEGFDKASIKRISPEGAVLNEFPVPAPCGWDRRQITLRDNNNDIDADGNILLLTATRVCKLDAVGNFLGIYYTGCDDIQTCSSYPYYLSAGPNGYVYFGVSGNEQITMDSLTIPFSTIGSNTFGNIPGGVDALQVTNDSVYAYDNRANFYEFGLGGDFKRVLSGDIQNDVWPAGVTSTSKDPFGNLLVLGGFNRDLTWRIVRLDGAEFKMLTTPDMDLNLGVVGMTADLTGRIYLGPSDGKILILSPQY